MIDMTIIGSGVMGSALAGAAVQGTDPQRVMVTDADSGKAQALAQRIHCRWGSNSEAVAQARYVTFCIKPHLLAAELTQLAPVFQKARSEGREQVVVTVVPAVTANTYRTLLGVPDLSVIRLVPNTACTVGKGLSLVMEDSTYQAPQLEGLLSLLAASGTFDVLPQAQYVAGAVVASTAPAFISMFAAAVEDAGVFIGLPRDRARRYALECLVSTGQMLLENGRHCESVKEDVCSPAGAGIRGVRALEAGGMRASVHEAIIQTFEQYSKLGDIG